MPDEQPNITRYNNYFEDADNIYIVMEFVNGGDLLGRPAVPASNA